MLRLDAVNDYYIDSNELRIFVQRLRATFEQVFELSLNTSLATGKLQGEVSDADVYEVVSQKVESVAKDLRRHISEMNDEANVLTRHSLQNKQTTALVQKFQDSLPLIHGEANKRSVEEAIQRLKDGVYESVREAKAHAKNLEDKLAALNHLNEKVWLTLGQLKVQLAQPADGEEGNINMDSVVGELTALSERIEKHLNQIQDKLEKIHKNLDSEFGA